MQGKACQGTHHLPFYLEGSYNGSQVVLEHDLQAVPVGGLQDVRLFPSWSHRGYHVWSGGMEYYWGQRSNRIERGHEERDIDRVRMDRI